MPKIGLFTSERDCIDPIRKNEDAIIKAAASASEFPVDPIEKDNQILARRHVQEGVALQERFNKLTEDLEKAKAKHRVNEVRDVGAQNVQWYKDILAP
jgi:hypothetical protein